MSQEKTRILTPVILVLVMLAISATFLYSMDQGYKFIRYYSDLEYDHAPQNWGVIQDRNGVLYFANQGGVLEYDGVTWRVHYIEGSSYIIRSLAIDESGMVFVGGNNQIWRLTPDTKGMMQLKSFTRYLHNEDKEFGTVFGTHVVDNKVYFRAKEFLFVWDREKMTTLKTAGIFKASFVHNGELLVQDGEKGLLKMVNNTLQPVPGGEAFTGSRIVMLIPLGGSAGDGTFLVGDSKSKLVVYKNGRVAPFQTEAQDYLDRHKLNHGIHLFSGDFALATRKGLLIIDGKGRLKQVIDDKTGLQNDFVRSVFQDTWGNLWLCLNKGISKIEYVSPFSIFDRRNNLPGIVLSVIRHKNKLFVGTGKGLYYNKSDGTFIRVPGIDDQCNSLHSTEGHLLAATGSGIFQLKKDIPVKVSTDQSLVLLKSRHFPDLVWCGTSTGLTALVLHNSQWREKFHLEDSKDSIKSIVETSNGDLWLGSTGENVFRVRFPNGFGQPEITTYGQGLFGGECSVVEVAGHVWAGTLKGLFKYDSNTNSFTPDTFLGKAFAGGENAKQVYYITVDKNKHIWFNAEARNYQAIPGPDGRYEIISQPFRRLLLIQTNAIYTDPELKTTWFARHDGLYGFDTTMEKNYRQSFATLIRKVVLNESSENPVLLFNGSSGNSVIAPPHPQIEFVNRNIYFEYAAPFFEAENRIWYRCFLEGYDNKWTARSKETKRNYTNLDPGSYRFRVQAENVHGTQSREAEYRFRILNPWYTTWWMYFVYIILSMFSIYLLVKGRSVKLEKDKKKLETEVSERTKEINQKNRQLQSQAEKLKEMDKVKSRFFANISHEFRTPLTLIMGPLEQMYSDSEDKKKKKDIYTMLRSSQRLLNLINQLLDLSRLDSGKEKLQAAKQDIVPFLEGIVANFEAVAKRKNLNLSFQTNHEDIPMYFDGQKMENVMSNLLINAVKYTPPNGNITVSVYKSEQEQENGTGSREFVKISVKDSGPGIPPDQTPFIFNRFYQAERSKTGHGEGTGIGLALVKEYVELHHGIIDVHTLEEIGTQFVLRFPTGHAHLEPGEITGCPQSVPETDHSLMEFETDLEIEENGGDTSTDTIPDQNGEEENGQKPVVLVVEDNTEMRRYICNPLKTDYSVIEAVDGDQGIEKAISCIPDLIVSDIMMPGKDGYQLCEVLKKDIRTSHIPIILLTAKASGQSVIQGLETGADDYITKPFNTPILLTRIKNLIDLRQHLQSKIQKQMLLQPDEINVSSMDRAFIDELKETIAANISDSGFRVEELSEKMYMDRTTIFRKIKALTGQSPQLFIRSYRLQRAAQLLKQQAGTVSQVASSVGFDNPGYFAKCFKEKYKMHPSSFKTTEAGPIENDKK